MRKFSGGGGVRESEGGRPNVLAGLDRRRWREQYPARALLIAEVLNCQGRPWRITYCGGGQEEVFKSIPHEGPTFGFLKTHALTKGMYGSVPVAASKIDLVALSSFQRASNASMRARKRLGSSVFHGSEEWL